MSPAPRIILASRSPRRLKLLQEAGLRVLQVPPPFADPPEPPPGHPRTLALALAESKARSVLQAGWPDRRDGDVVLAADTIVIGPDGRLLGQPGNRTDAQQMLQSLLGARHQVLTALALARWTANPHAPRPRPTTDPAIETLTDTADVRIGPVPAAELQQYLDSGDWAGKAGAYNLAEIDSRWPVEVEGDPTTVVGLPMKKLLERLQRWGVQP